jgi:signal transduction histidine kinase
VKAILDAHALDPQAAVGVPQVIRTGRSELRVEATAQDVTADVEAPRALAAELADIDVSSTMCVPLIARNRTLGAILFIAAESKRRYTEEDLRLAEELAARAALALDNSRLYREAEERAQAARALATIADGVFLVDGEGIIRIWNSAAEAITGHHANDVRGRSARDVLRDWDRISELIPIGEPGQLPPLAPHTVPVALPRGELWLSISGVGSAEGTVYAFRDVTSEIRLDRLKSEFVATVSHELRTPLAAVYGAAVTLAQRDLSQREDVREQLVSQIAEQSERLAAIVEDILLTGELDAGRLRLERAEVDPVEVTRAAVEAARPRLPNGTTLELVAGDVGRLETDAGRLRQVLDNLIENAIKYSPNGGRTEVRLDANDTVVRLSVEDRGVGIPAEEHERIFEKFYRLDPDQTHGVGGSGLGLYVCRELVARMEGRISVESAPGRGSTFTIELPRRPHAS